MSEKEPFCILLTSTAFQIIFLSNSQNLPTFALEMVSWPSG